MLKNNDNRLCKLDNPMLQISPLTVRFISLFSCTYVLTNVFHIFNVFSNQIHFFLKKIKKPNDWKTYMCIRCRDRGQMVVDWICWRLCTRSWSSWRPISRDASIPRAPRQKRFHYERAFSLLWALCSTLYLHRCGHTCGCLIQCIYSEAIVKERD